LAWSYSSGDTGRSFYRRRIARIVPSYWVACMIALPLLMRNDKINSPASLALHASR